MYNKFNWVKYTNQKRKISIRSFDRSNAKCSPPFSLLRQTERRHCPVFLTATLGMYEFWTVLTGQK